MSLIRLLIHFLFTQHVEILNTLLTICLHRKSASIQLIYGILILFLMCFSRSLQAQVHSQDYSPDLGLIYTSRAVIRPSIKPEIQHLAKLPDSPFKQNKSELRNKKRTSLLLSSVVLLSFGTDIYMRRASQKQRYHSLDWWFSRTNRLGEIDIIAKTFGIGLASGLLIDSPRLKQSSVNIIRSYLISKVITDVTKRSFGRARPFLENGNTTFEPSMAAKTSNYRSYISGHTSTAWALVTPFAEEYSRWLYVLPASTAIARIYRDRHWASDVVAGALVGFLAGYNTHHSDRFTLRFTGNGFRVLF